MTPVHKDLLQELQSFAVTAPSAQALMEQMAKRLHEKMTRYNWVGFYLVDPADPGYLIVGPYVGSFPPTRAFRSTPVFAALPPPAARSSSYRTFPPTRAISLVPLW